MLHNRLSAFVPHILCRLLYISSVIIRSNATVIMLSIYTQDLIRRLIAGIEVQVFFTAEGSTATNCLQSPTFDRKTFSQIFVLIVLYSTENDEILSFDEELVLHRVKTRLEDLSSTSAANTTRDNEIALILAAYRRAGGIAHFPLEGLLDEHQSPEQNLESYRSILRLSAAPIRKEREITRDIIVDAKLLQSEPDLKYLYSLLEGLPIHALEKISPAAHILTHSQDVKLGIFRGYLKHTFNCVEKEDDEFITIVYMRHEGILGEMPKEYLADTRSQLRQKISSSQDPKQLALYVSTAYLLGDGEASEADATIHQYLHCKTDNISPRAIDHFRRALHSALGPVLTPWPVKNSAFDYVSFLLGESFDPAKVKMDEPEDEAYIADKASWTRYCHLRFTLSLDHNHAYSLVFSDSPHKRLV